MFLTESCQAVDLIEEQQSVQEQAGEPSSREPEAVITHSEDFDTMMADTESRPETVVPGERKQLK